MFSKGNGYSKSDLLEVGTPIILYGRLYTKYQFYIDGVDTFAEIKSGAVFSKGNEVIVPASGETAEDIARASAVGKSGILLGGDLNIIHPFDYINPKFLALAISNGNPQKELAKKAQGKSVVHIHNSDIQEVNIFYPSSEEQDQIVSVFTHLDTLITLHQRKHVYLYIECKKIANSGNLLTWEQRKFGNIAERLSTTAYSNGDLPYVEYEDVISEQGTLNKDVFCKESQKTGIVFSEHNVLYGKLRPYLHNWLIPDFKGVAVGDWWVLNPINSDKNFVYRLIQSENFDTIANQSTGTKMPRADWKLVSQTEFAVPISLAEQHQIGAYFRNLDALITLHQRKPYS